MSDLVLRGGRVLDPARGVDGRLDVRVSSGRIAAVAATVEPREGDVVREVTGHVVVPGLIDAHLHLFDGAGPFGAAPDTFGVESAVTTVVDAGSAGHSLIPVFARHIAEPARSRVLAFVNLSTLGIVVGPRYPGLGDPRLIDEDGIAAAIEAHRELIVGIKIMATGTSLGAEGLTPLRRARRLADTMRVPLMVHVGESWGGDAAAPSIAELLTYLRPGDVVTHMFTGHPGGLLDGNGRLWPAVRDAAASGIRFDVGHGLHNVDFGVARRVLDQGLEPDTISTDGHRLNRAGPVYDLPTTMAKMMALGMPLSRVVDMATARAARLLGREDTLGSLEVGRTADISVLRIEEREWTAEDSGGGTLRAPRTLVPVFCVRAGHVHEASAQPRP